MAVHDAISLLLLVVASVSSNFVRGAGYPPLEQRTQVVYRGQASVLLQCPKLQLRTGDEFRNWYVAIAGSDEMPERVNPLDPRYTVNSSTKDLRLNRLTQTVIDNLVYQCCFKRDGQLKYSEVRLLVAPERPSSVSVSSRVNSKNGPHLLVTWNAPSDKRLNFTLQVERVLSEPKSDKHPLLVKYYSVKDAKRKKRLTKVHLGANIDEIIYVRVKIRATDANNVSSNWTESQYWPYCEDIERARNIPSHAWSLVSAQKSPSSITLMWSFQFGQLSKSQRWRQRTEMHFTIAGRSDNSKASCKKTETTIPAFGTPISSSAHALDITRLTPRCNYTVHGRIMYSVKYLDSARKRKLIPTYIEAMATTIPPAAEDGVSPSPAMLLLRIEVYHSFKSPANYIRIQAHTSRAAYFSKTFCGATYLKPPKNTDIVRRRRCASHSCIFSGVVAYPLMVPHDAELFHECFRERVASLSALNGKLGLKVTRSAVYDGAKKTFTAQSETDWVPV